LGELTKDYSTALREYCAEGGEAALFQAYQFGRRAAGEGLGVLEMAALHQEALLAVLRDADVDESTCVARRAAEFFADCLAPFELARRGYQEKHDTLYDLNRRLEQQLGAAREIPAPARSIHDSLSLLKSGVGGDLNAQGHRLLDVACRNGRQLMRLVDELLDVRRIESGAGILDTPTPVPAGSRSGLS